jgi:cytochrome P450
LSFLISVDGKVIPKGSIIFAFVYGVHMNENAWGDPQNYRPERFLGIDPVFEQRNFIPFSVGPRECVGKNLVTEQINYVMPRLLHKFK